MEVALKQGQIMTMPIAYLFGVAGLLGMPVTRFVGTSAAVIVCLVLAGLLPLVHFIINFWFELNRTA